VTDGVSVNVEWLVGSDQALGEVGTKATQKNVLKRTITPPANDYAEAWRAIAPRRTGHYAFSIHVGTQLTRRQKSSAYRAGGLGVVELHIGTTDPAGVQLEFGNHHQVAQPSGRPAWEQKKHAVLEGIGKNLWVEIEKSAAKAARKRAKAGL
jgi:hypothetical protein